MPAKSQEMRNEYVRKHRALYPERALDAKLRYRYGITLEQYLARVENQSGVCAICGRQPDEGKKLYVDHDHDTGDVRGLLCFSCNTGIARFGDDPEVLLAAIRYLEDR